MAVLASAGVLPAIAADACVPVHAYVDCSAKMDGKGSIDSPYRTLADANRLSLSAGDSVDLRRGTTCRGTLSPSGSGDASQPVRIGAYGTGTAPPVIEASGGAPAVRLDNQHDIAISGLDLTSSTPAASAGLTVTASDYGPMSGIAVRDLDIHNVGNGITIAAQGTALPSAVDDVTIAGNRIHDISGDGVVMTSNWCRRPDVAPDWHPACAGAWDPGRGLRISANVLIGIGGDGIDVSATQGASIAHNWLDRFAGAGISVSGSASPSVDANQVAGGRETASQPGAGYQVGAATDHATLAGNLSHDNAGGFLRFLATPQAPVGPVSVAGNLSVDDRARDFSFAGGPVVNGSITGNTIYIGRGVGQEVADSTTDVPLDVQFAGNIVAAAPGVNSVGWNLPNPGWVVRDDLLSGVPAPASAHSLIRGEPGFAAPGGVDAFGYRLLPGSAALGSGVPVPAGFPLGLTPVPASAPNVGAVQAAAGPPVVLTDTFDLDATGAAPDGWQVSGAASVTADPGGLTGRSLTLTGPATVARSFSATGGSVRADLRLLASQADKPLVVKILDTHGRTMLQTGLSPAGTVAYSDDGAVRDSAFGYPAGAWTSLSLLLRPSAGSYTITADGLPAGEGKLASGTGVPDRLVVSSAAPGARFAVDDVIVSPACCPC